MKNVEKKKQSKIKFHDFHDKLMDDENQNKMLIHVFTWNKNKLIFIERKVGKNF